MPDSDTQLETLIEKGKVFFTSAGLQQWLQAIDKLDNAGYGASVVLAYARHAPLLAQLADEKSAQQLASVVSLCAIRVNRVAAALLSKIAVNVCKVLADKDDFQHWLHIIEVLIEKAPAAVEPTLERSETILHTLNVQQFKSWVYTGIRLTGDSPQNQRQYFSIRNAEAEKWLRREAGDVVFTNLHRTLKLFLVSLWSVNAPMRVLRNHSSPLTSRRITVSNGVIMAPEIFPGFHGEQAKDLYFAGLAHVGAHLAFSNRKFPRGELKPIQIAVISLLEDARVEYLAMQAFPGLRELWQPFHTVRPIKQNLVPVLLARLSRALIDPDYQDDNGWIIKARKLFFAKEHDFADARMCRRIGVLLGNDLGQLRAQFNAKTYVIEPPYRDDNVALWSSDGSSSPQQDEQIVGVEAVRMSTCHDNPMQQEEKNQHNSTDREESEKVAYASDDPAPQHAINAVFRYTEFDYEVSTERPNWTRVVERIPDWGNEEEIDNMLDQHIELLNRVTQLIRSANVSMPTRLMRQSFGDTLDLDACIHAVISRRMRETPDTRVYMRSERRQRDLAVLVLLDISNSTNDRVSGSATTILDLELQATTLLAYALSELGDPFAISAFCSDGRKDVHYYRLKDFERSFDTIAKRNMAGVRGRLSTRLGAALRHAASQLSHQRSQRKLLLLITDGEPSDIDVDDPRYLVEDARKAIWSIAHRGIDTFCVSLDAKGESTMGRIFGQRNVTHIDNLQRLPERLPMLYLRLTR